MLDRLQLASSFKRHVPLVVGLLSVTATFLATLQLDLTIQQRDETRFDTWVEKTYDNASERIYNYTNMLRGQRGLFIASNAVTSNEFDRYIDSMDIADRYPAILGIGFAMHTPAEQRDAVESRLRRQNRAIEIWPQPPADAPEHTLYPTIYFRPTQAGYPDLLGMDIAATAVGRDAMRRSRESLDAVATSDRLAIPPGYMRPATIDAQLFESNRQFAIYLPVFKDELFAGRMTGERADVTGYLYMVIDTDVYWHSIFQPLSRNYLDVYAYNGLVINPAAMEYGNGRAGPGARSGVEVPKYQRTVTIDLAGRPWTLLFQSKPSFEALSTRTAVVPVTFGVGLLASLALFVLARSQMLAWMTARQTNDELQRSERQLREINETLEQRVAERTAMAERRAAQVRRLAAEVTQIEQRERRRLARTLHDHLQQLLVAARLRLELMQPDTPAEDLQTTRAELDGLLRDAINASRSLTIELSPPILHESGLVDCLHWLARHIHQQHRLDVTVQVEGDAASLDRLVSSNGKIMLFESAREALLNVTKYAGVNEAWIELRYNAHEQMLELAVVDRGAGFDGDKLVLRGTGVERFGLFSIRERLELHDGRLIIDAAPGRGTRVIFRLPTEEPAATSAAVTRPA